MTHPPSPLPLWTPWGSCTWSDLSGATVHVADDCGSYWACLARAAVEDWAGLSCAACQAYDPDSRAHVVRTPLREMYGGPRACPAPALLDAWAARLEDRSYKPPPLAVTDERVGGRRLVLERHTLFVAAQRAGLVHLPVVRVARARCPSCDDAQQLRLIDAIEPVLTDGFCPSCRRYLDADAVDIEYIEGVRSREYERLVRERRRRGRWRAVAKVAKGMATVATCVADAAEQLSLLGEEDAA